MAPKNISLKSGSIKERGVDKGRKQQDKTRGGAYNCREGLKGCGLN